MSRSTRRIAGVALAGACVAALAAPALAAPAAGPDTGKAPGNTQFDIQLLSFNDFHGNLDAPTGSSGRITIDHFYTDVDDIDGDGNRTEQINFVNAGGVEYLATELAQARKGHPYSLTVAAGDIVGASPLLSAAFHDEPTIESMNKLGLDVTSVGNHEFDEGYKELQRLAHGGCIDDGDGQNNQNSCPDGVFGGANFDMLAANVVETSTGKTILPAYTVKKFNGAKIGFIGMTLEGTPSIVTASGVAGLSFKDEAETANALVPVLKAQGVNAIVVLLHEGAAPTQNGKSYDWACQAGGSISGALVDINANLDPAIDMVVSGHTHQPYVCTLPDPAGKPRLVTSASSFGRLYTDTTLTYDRRTSDIVRPTMASSANHIVERTVAKDPAQTALIAKYKTLVSSIANKVLGQVAGSSVTRSANPAGESPLGDLIADAQLADPSTIPSGGTAPVISFMNAGGIRADLVENAAGDVTYEAAFTVQPFNNYLVSMDLTGQQIIDVLNQQFINSSGAPARPYVLATSAGLTYTHNRSTVSNVLLNGAPLVPTAKYRIVTNNFLSDGGDGFPAFRNGTGKYFGGLDIDAFANYLAAHSPYTPPPLDRVTYTP
ncbi:bifunctional metallophosphatase/5'-nucleotidase [Intrasporangium sp. YIM S08009]|uniref:bifunctional metallophosphatase/5'-nucleotidase n=1 Tax=Intrasporangium zincisolvens TaxID=3080018 RepID=UPI002B05C90E|nr:bifunctional metallophosphatase/5'-nucleotidase [Intrasporangium sp. YIM S08009]